MENLPLISLPKQTAADTGTIEGSVVPVVFGEVKVGGNILWMGNIDSTTNGSKIIRYGNAVKAYIAEAWYSICMGFDSLLKVLANDKQLIDGVDYDSTQINRGSDPFVPDISAVANSVIVGDSGYIYWSADKKIWTPIFIGTAKFNDVVFANNQFMAVGNSGQIFISPNGVDWTDKSLTGYSSENIISVCYGADKYVITTDHFILASPDGNFWIVCKALDPSFFITKVVYGAQYYVAVGYSLGIDPVAYYSIDGITWNNATSLPSPSAALLSLCFSKTKNRYIAGAVGGQFTYSDDNGKTWSHWVRTSIPGDNINAICEGVDSKLFAVTPYRILSSNDFGAIWTSVYGVPGGGRSKIIYDRKALYTSSASTNLIESSVTGHDGTWSFYLASGYTKANSIASSNYQPFEFVNKLKGIAHIFFSQAAGARNQNPEQRVVLNSDNKTPDMKFVVQNTISSFPSYPVSNIDTGKFLGANPAMVLYDILLNSQWGIGTGDRDFTSFSLVAQSFVDSQAQASKRLYGVNFILNQLTTAKDVFDKIRDTTDIFCTVQDIQIGEIAQSRIVCKNLYNNDPKVASLTDDDLKECSIKLQSWEELYNDFEGEYIEPLLNYAKRSIYVKNEAAIELAGGITKKKKIDLTYFIDQDVASVRLNEIMQRESRPRITISCASSHILAMVNPGDTVELNSTEYSISGLFTAIQKSVGENNDLTINIDLQQRYYDLFDLNSISVMSSLGLLPAYQGTQTKTTLLFPAYSSLSNVTLIPILDSTNVAFTPGQGLPEGVLARVTDYLNLADGEGNNWIGLLNRWKATVEHNSLGLLSIDLWN